MNIYKINRTLVIMKPDAIQRQLTAPILRRFEDNGLVVARMKIHQFGKPVFEEHYKHIKAKVADQRIFHNVVDWMSSIPLLYIDLRGEDAARRVKEMAGPTDPSKAPTTTIRGEYGIDTKEKADKELRATYNLLHTSDPESAEKEIRLFFNGLYRSFILTYNFITSVKHIDAHTRVKLKIL